MLNAAKMNKIWKPMLGTCLMIFGAGLPSHVRADTTAGAASGKNAFDVYLDALQSLVDIKKVGFAVASTHSSGDPDDRDYTLAEKQALLAENSEALMTLRSGFAFTYLNPRSHSIGDFFPYFARFRAIARLLKLEGDVKAAQGDWTGAADSDLDAIKVGEDIAHGSVLIGDLAGVACQTLGRRPLWDDIDHLDAKQASADMSRLQTIQASHFAFAETMTIEKETSTDSLKQILHDPRWHNNVAAVMIDLMHSGKPGGADTEQLIKDFTPTITDYWTAANQSLLSNFTAADVLANNNAYWDHIISITRQPYAAKLPLPEPSSDPLSNFMREVVAKSHLVAVDNETQNSLLIVALALRAYDSDQNSYPTSLSQLVPKYLKQVPADLFAMSGPLLYHRTNDKYVLYSVGPDGKDDGGQPIDNPVPATGGDTSTHARLLVHEDSTGDIVAGVNIY